jgi:prolyl-tRNA editing enzyme YbaK/EbsC (Cys-tRNA(Pro) deacylase)
MRKKLLRRHWNRGEIMLNEMVYGWLDKKGYADRITEHTDTIDTVEHAAQQIGCAEAEIAKTLSFVVDEKPLIVVMAGDGRVNSSKFKAQFHTKPSMVPRDRVEEMIGFAPGGVCPFGVREGIPVWLDISMKRFEYIYPAGGNEYVSVKLTPEELEKASDAVGWCDVCKGWEE